MENFDSVPFVLQFRIRFKCRLPDTGQESQTYWQVGLSQSNYKPKPCYNAVYLKWVHLHRSQMSSFPGLTLSPTPSPLCLSAHRRMERASFADFLQVVR